MSLIAARRGRVASVENSGIVIYTIFEMLARRDDA